ncbi:MAG: ABC transporter permease [Tissierellia bacterium]|nr:ABC transporter permease [Tissierellia bacterium]
MNSKLRDLLLFNIAAVILGLVVSGIMIAILGHNPLEAYKVLFTAVFRDRYTFADVFVKATPFMFSGLAFAFTFKANLFNIGAQGQFYMGAIASVAISLALQNTLPGPIVLIFALLGAILLGGLWGSLIGVAKAKRGSNEFLLSMMSTYVALNIMNYLLRTVLIESKGEYPQTDPLIRNVWLPSFISKTRLHIGFILAVLTCIGIWILLYKTGFGYRVRAVGNNSRAAALAGINSDRIYILSFFIAGGLASMAGFTEVNGVQHMLLQGFNPEIGAAGIGIAILANANPIGIIFASVLFGLLEVGGVIMGQMMGIPSSIIQLMEGFVMIFVIMSYFFRRKVEKNREIKKLKEATND